jgi:hypothetical protein
MNLILGLDISTAVTGYTVLNSDTGDLIAIDYIDTKSKSFWESTNEIRNRLQALLALGTYKDVFIEESLQQFRSGFSSAHTLSTLAKMNGIVSYIVLTMFGIEPKYISSANARSKCGIKLIRASTSEEKKDPRFTKKQIFDHVLATRSELKGLHWPTTKSTPKNPLGRLQDQCFDMIDSYVIAYSGYLGCKSTQLA